MKSRGKFIFYLALSALIIGIKLADYQSLELMELRLQDALFEFKQSSSPSKEVVLVTIDEVSLKSIGPWPWKEEVVADLIAAVGAGEPRTTLVDFPLSENSAATPSEALSTIGITTPAKLYKHKSQKSDTSGSSASVIAEQFVWMDNVIIAYNVIPSLEPNDTVVNTPYLFRNALITNNDLGRLHNDQALSVNAVALPENNLSNVAARLGFSFSRVDSDDVLRSEPLVMNYNGYYYPSAALSAASHYLHVLPQDIIVNGGESIELLDRTIPTNGSGEMLLNFPAEGSGFEIFSATDVLNERVKPDFFKDRIIIITLATGVNTEYYKSPVSEELPHYLKTAIAVDNIINQEYLRRADSHLGWYIIALALIGILSAFALQMISSLYRIIVVALALVALVNVNYFLFNSFHVMANSLYVALQLVLFLIATPLTSLNYGFITNRFKRKSADELGESTPASDKSDLKRVGWRERRKRTAKFNQPFNTTGKIVDDVAAGDDVADELGATMVLPSPGSIDANQTMVLSPNKSEENESAFDANETLMFNENAPATHSVAPVSEDVASANAEQSADVAQAAHGDLAVANIDSTISAGTNQASVSTDITSDSDSIHTQDPGAITLDDDDHQNTSAPVVPAENIDRISVYRSGEQTPQSHEPAIPAEENIELFGTGIIKVGESATPARGQQSPQVEQHPQDQLQQLKPASPTPSAPTPITPTPELQTADGKLGRYKLEGILGKGAMGLVYRGVDPVINRTVALKTIRMDFLTDPEEIAEMKERLFYEAQAAGKLSHPNIVVIYDVGEEASIQYIAMEYLEGQTLEDMIKRKVNFNFKILAKMIYQICSALQYAHGQGIVHRDIKPANIMVLPDYSVKVLDFGIARIESSSMTKTGVAMGTPNYISPEQLSGEKVDGRSDLFSLGVMFYEMMLGVRPFKGENLTALIYSVMNKEPEIPSKINPRIPPLFDMIIKKALQKDPAKRYQKASDMANALSDFVQSFATR
ncbi:CHASE2 domain-containing protein [Gemmatimonas aurantiaca]|nr:CHASE2 domain-containing protein [Gemmatimonas aurantiaca]